MGWQLLVLVYSGFCTFFSAESGFREKQLEQPRVRGAYQAHLSTVHGLLREKQIPTNQLYIFIRILKQEKQLEVWAKGREQAKYRLLRQYPFCAVSGTLGPKRVQGDGQIPEGVYFINRFHPTSNYHLSLGLNYPNAADRARAATHNPGGDIFIHGGCVTIGCVPITNTGIEELYVLAVEARNSGQVQIPVHIFPVGLTAANLNWLSGQYQNRPGLLAFWQNLQPVYTSFEQEKTLPKIGISAAGYTLEQP